MAQPPPPNPNQPLRVVLYRNDFILGYAPAGSTVNLYYATAASPCFKAFSTPFASVTADENNAFAYTSLTSSPFLPFAAPVVVSYIKPGTTTEVFESSVIGPDEISISPNNCTGISTVGMYPGVSSEIIWRDLSGTERAKGVFVTLPAGSYTMEYRNLYNCLYKSQLITVPPSAPVARPQPNLLVPCGERVMDVFGQFDGEADAYRWERQSDGVSVGSTRLVTLGPGKYYFSAMAPGGCWSNKAEIIIEPPGVIPQLIMAGVRSRDADCGQENGSIIGADASMSDGTPLTFDWVRKDGVVFPEKDLLKAAPGIYRFRATPSDGKCPVYSGEIEVKELNRIDLDFSSYNARESATFCGLNNGKITGFVTKNATVFNWYKLKTDGSGEHDGDAVSTSRDLENASPGYYELVLSNQYKDCVYTWTGHIAEGSPAIRVNTEPVVVDDNCGLEVGSIIGIRMNTPIRKYTWTNANGAVVGTDADLKNVPAGRYQLRADNDKCYNDEIFYEVKGTTISVASPVMEDVIVCAASTVYGNFKETAPLYRIYDEGGTLISQKTTKDFSIKVQQPGNYFAALANGDCESRRIPFSISFGSSGLEIPSAFSPNGDGQNDQWVIRGIERYDTPEVKIFNRQGVVVFHTTGRSQAFDGKDKGADLPVGVYYYLVKASAECPQISGSLTLIR